MSGDWIGLFPQGVNKATWSVSVAAAINTGTYSLSVPNSPGTAYNFGYVRNGYILSYSSLVTCLAAPSSYPTPAPSTPTVTPTLFPTAFTGSFYFVDLYITVLTFIS